MNTKTLAVEIGPVAPACPVNNINENERKKRLVHRNFKTRFCFTDEKI